MKGGCLGIHPSGCLGDEDGAVSLVFDPFEIVVKHGSHDQSSHGNWARGGGFISGHAVVPGRRSEVAHQQALDDLALLESLDPEGDEVYLERDWGGAPRDLASALASVNEIEFDDDGMPASPEDNDLLTEAHEQVYDFWMSTFDNADNIQQAAVNLLDAEAALDLDSGEGKRILSHGAASFMLGDLERTWNTDHALGFTDANSSPLYRGMKMDNEDWGFFFGEDRYKGSPVEHVGETIDLNLSSFSVHEGEAGMFSTPHPHSTQRPVIIQTKGYVAGFGSTTGEVVTAGRFRIVDVSSSKLSNGKPVIKMVIEQEGVWDAP